MTQKDEVDELYDVKTSYYIGNYQQCINESQKVKLSDPVKKIERDTFLYRAYVAQKKYRVVMDEIKPMAITHEGLRAIRTFTDYMMHPNQRDTIINNLPLEDSLEPTYLIMRATLHLQQRDPESALRYVQGVDHIECAAVAVQTLLAMDRVDLARKELKRMQEIDEDCVLTQLAQAWTSLASIGDKYQDAYYIYQELADKHSPTPLLLNGMAAAYGMQGKWEEADGVLHEALDKDPNNPETLVNLAVVSQHLGRPAEVGNRYMSQLRDQQTVHPVIEQIDNKLNEFQRISAQYRPSVEST